MFAAGASLVSGALWLRTPSIRYLVASAAATAVAAAMLFALPARARRWAAASAVATAALVVLAGAAQGELWRIEYRWEGYRERLLTRGSRMLGEELNGAARHLTTMAARALRAPSDTAGAFAHLERLTDGPGERGVVLYRRDGPMAWSGTIRVPTDTLRAALGALQTPFYLALYAVADSAGSRAVATVLVHAEAPGDSLASELDSRVVERAGVRGFRFSAPGAGDQPEDLFDYVRGADTLFSVRPVPPSQTDALGAARARIRSRGAGALAAALLLFGAASWRRSRTLSAQLATLAVALGCLSIMPLTAFSSESRLFDPTVYYARLGDPLTARLGDPFTSSVGALALTSAIVLLGLMTVLRARVRVPRWASVAAVLLIMGFGPFLLRDLARGITPPPGGVTLQLWLAWEVALFLAACSLLLAASAAGRAALGTRGLPPGIAPAIAAAAALVGPLVLRESGRWPGWYPLLWIAAIGALALARRHRALVVTAASVAALGAATLTWGAGVRGRMELALRDVGQLSTPEPFTYKLLEWYADSLERGPPPRTEADLLRRYVGSDLAGAGYPVELTSWAPDGLPVAKVNLTTLEARALDVNPVVRHARATDSSQMAQVLGRPGVQLVLAVPYRDGWTSAVVVQPRTRLIPDDPNTALLGISPRERGEPPYSLTLNELPPGSAPRGAAAVWVREGSDLHAHQVISTADGLARVHVEVELRSLEVLVQYGALVVLLDLLILVGLWTVSVLPNRALARWVRARWSRWRTSYRARLTLALFAFFVIPAVAFAAWSYRRLQAEDRQSRELLVRETLRRVAAGQLVGSVADLGLRQGTPLFLYRDGMLRETSDPLYDALAPLGRFLDPEVFLRLEVAQEVQASEVRRIGSTNALLGYRTASGLGGGRVVVAAPAPGNEEQLDRRRRDLGVLVLFATVVGAFAALWLSGFAARSLARPIGTLRRAALALAGGEREPPLTTEPPEEFVPVFSAFRRMAHDLGTSRSALEDAQRRTSAVLRNVASGVVAVDAQGLIVLANPSAEGLLARTLPAGAPLDVVGSGELTTRVRAFLDGDAEEEEFELALDGRQLHARLARLARRRGGAVLTLDDVTELARAQRVLAWGEMARQIAHEIKNPLTPIRLGVQHLRRARSRPDFEHILEQNVERILAEIDRLDRIARSFSRYGTAPAQLPPPEPTDIASVLRDIIDLERLGRGTVEWAVDGVEVPVRAQARSEELREVLLNVLENARLAGARRVDVRVARSDGVVRIDVADDGHGIPPHVLPRIFEPHFSTRTSGSGLGLAISRQLVEGWGGAITIDSSEGQGTRVRIALLASGG